VLENIATEIGKDIEQITNDLRQKESYIKLMNQKNITYFKDVSKAINMYYIDPKKAIKKIEAK